MTRNDCIGFFNKHEIMDWYSTIYDRARAEVVNFQLPGRQDGLADAYGPIIASADAIWQDILSQ